MSLVEKFASWLADTERKEAEALKRQGVYVSRPVLNGADWEAWAKEWGIPSPLAAADIHVTVMYSTVDVKMAPDDCPMVVPVRNAQFALFGPDEDAFVVAFRDWSLQDRHWAYVENGAAPTYPTYRPHMTLSTSAKGFEVADEALAEAPEYIILGPEVAGPLKGQPAPDDQDPEGADAEDDGDDMILVIEIAMSAAEKELERQDLDPVTRTALYDISKGRPVTLGVAKRLNEASPDVALALATSGDLSSKRPSVLVAKKRQERDIELRMTEPMHEAVRKAGQREVFKTDDEQRLIYAISNVYSIGGVPVEDSDGEGFTTRAMEEFIGEVLKRDKSGSFEHSPDLRNVVVQGFVLSHEVQKALGIDLGYEALLTATHFPDEADWAKAKQGDWEQSIKGRFWYYED